MRLIAADEEPVYWKEEVKVALSCDKLSSRAHSEAESLASGCCPPPTPRHPQVSTCSSSSPHLPSKLSNFPSYTLNFRLHFVLLLLLLCVSVYVCVLDAYYLSEA